jgi:hypothetical protein
MVPEIVDKALSFPAMALFFAYQKNCKQTIYFALTHYKVSSNSCSNNQVRSSKEEAEQNEHPSESWNAALSYSHKEHKDSSQSEHCWSC